MIATALQGTDYAITSPTGETITTTTVFQPTNANPTLEQQFEGFMVSVFAAMGTSTLPAGMFTDPSAGIHTAIKKFTRQDIKRFLKRLKSRKVIRTHYMGTMKLITLTNPPF